MIRKITKPIFDWMCILKIEDDFRRQETRNFKRVLRDAREERLEKERLYKSACVAKGEEILRCAKLCKAKHGKHLETTEMWIEERIGGNTVYYCSICEKCGVIFRTWAEWWYLSAECIGNHHLKGN